MSMPMVSIVIPVYNGANYLREAIDSALAQTYPNIEVIVVNDGSRDNGVTEEIALSYGDQIRYFYKVNGGVATALNLGIKHMKGEYFSWLSHDDMYTLDKIAEQIQALRECGDMTAIVYSEYDVLDVNRKSSFPIQISNAYSEEQLTNSVFPVLQNLVHGCTLLIHRQHFKRAGVFDETLITTQDYDLWFRMLRHQRTVFIPKSLVISRVHDDQGSKTISRHDMERSELHLGFMDKLTEEEMISMYGSPYNYYHQIGCFFKGINLDAAYLVSQQKLKEAKVPVDLADRLATLQDHINSLSNGKATHVCIFGAGVYGNRLLQELTSKLIQVDFFSDNNPINWGQTIRNVPCISLDELQAVSAHTLVIVAARSSMEIVSQLRELRFPFITTKQDLDPLLFSTPPAKAKERK